MAANPTATQQRPRPLSAIFTGRTFILVLRVFLGAVFVYSSADKVFDPARFAIAVRGYELIPMPLTNIFALVLAWAELIAGIMLVFGIYARQAAAAILLLLVMFIIAIGTTTVRGMVIDCGCFSNEGGAQTGYWLIIRNVFLSAVALMVMRFENGSAGLTRYFSRRQASERA
jgi:uncharacterized membrane protein YphA (DoxX/SURF4 family)